MGEFSGMLKLGKRVLIGTIVVVAAAIAWYTSKS